VIFKLFFLVVIEKHLKENFNSLGLDVELFKVLKKGIFKDTQIYIDSVFLGPARIRVSNNLNWLSIIEY